MKTTLHFLLFLCVFFSYAQSAIIGTVLDNNNVPIPGANVIITGTKIGAVTNFDGIFTITNQSVALPITIKVSSIGFESNSLLVTNTAQKINIILEEGSTLDEIVISASRTPERIFESPVTIERFGLKEIKNTTAADFYSGLENLKGVDVNTNR